MKTEQFERMIVNGAELREMLGCGRRQAYKIGTEAAARVQVGSRVYWNLSKIRQYLDGKAEGGKNEAGL